MSAEVVVFPGPEIEPPCDVEPLIDARLYALLAPTIIQTLRELIKHSEFCSVNEALAISIEANRLRKAVLR